jgi:hypothetical protein
MKILNKKRVRTLDQLNFGCSRKDIKPDMINLDIREYDGVDIVIDVLKEKMPFKKDQFKYVHMVAILEHIQEWEKVLYALRPYCADGCVIFIDVPYYNSANASASIEHVRYFGVLTLVSFVGCGNNNAGKTIWEQGPTVDVPTFVGKFIPRIPCGKSYGLPLNTRIVLSWFVGHIIGGLKTTIVVKK